MVAVTHSTGAGDQVRLLAADARSLPLPDESVQCIVTSPPYWGLREYSGEQELVWGGQTNCEHEFVGAGRSQPKPDRSTAGKDGNGSGVFVDDIPRGSQGAKAARGEPLQFGETCRKCGTWRGAFGLEPTIELYVEHTVEILRECRRVLRNDGVLWWNIGDSYCSQPKGSNKGWDKSGLTSRKDGSRSIEEAQRASLTKPGWPPQGGLKSKDLCLIPFRVALAAQADGWWVRSVIVWSKPNRMPESIRDRPTTSHEYILLLTKSPRYFWDAEAVREPYKDAGSANRKDFRCERYLPENRVGQVTKNQGAEAGGTYIGNGASELGRNLRSVWEFPTQAYSEAHFATFPEELPRRCILAGTSEKGACPKCGAPWVRVVEKEPAQHTGESGTAYPSDSSAGRLAKLRQAARESGQEYASDSSTVGWRPSCECGAGDPVPCVVLDPFGGSGTVGKVAIELGRSAVLCDIAYHETEGGEPSYIDLARKRTRNVQRPLGLEAVSGSCDVT